ncbi:MAG: PAS domain S-box protein, partial [Syntrophales bacterium]
MKSPVPMSADICCLNFKGLILYLCEHFGTEGVRTVVSGLVGNEQYFVSDKYEPSKIIPIEEIHLTDSSYWVSNDFSVRLLGNVKKVVAGSEPLVKAGEQSIIRHLSQSNLFVARIFGPQLIVKQAPKINKRFNMTKDVILHNVTKNSATFELRYKPGYSVTKDVCDWNRGIYMGIAKAAGAQHVRCEEIQCVVGGDNCCLFRTTWKSPSLKTTLLKWFMKESIGELLSDYEDTLRDRDQLTDYLKRSEERYRGIYENAVMGIVQSTRGGKIITANPAFARNLGYESPEEVVNKVTDMTREVYVNPECHLEFLRMMDHDGVVREFETQFFKKDGNIVWVSINARAVQGDQGMLLCYEGTVHDITERKRADIELRKAYGNLRAADEQMRAQYNSLVESQRSLRESEEKYRNILENIDEAYFELDLKGNITFFNDSACSISGYSKSELMGMNYRQYASPDTASKLKSSFVNIYQAGEKWSLSDFELIKKDKSTRNMELSVNLMRNSGGEAIGFRCIARDVTERKRAEGERRLLEERLQRAEKMEALGTLAGGVAHDLNNVLGIVVGYAEMLLMDVDESSPIREDLVNIMSGGQRAAAIVQDLLALARRGVSGRKVL